MIKRIALVAVLSFWFTVACQGATSTPAPSPTPGVTVIYVVATPVPTIIPFPTPLPTATATTSRAPQTSTRTRTATRAPATSTRPRPTATAAPSIAPPAAPPGTLLDGDYASTGSIRAQFTVSDGGTVASAGYFNYHCPVDGVLSTYGFTDLAAIVEGKFAFSALPGASGAPRVSMVCTATTSTQARCTIRNLLATGKCLDTPVNAGRK